MMTDIITINKYANNLKAVLKQVDAVAAYKALSPKQALQLRLLAEETMAMVRAITGNVNGEFWIEDHDGVYELHLKADTLTTEAEREQLISASTTGKNEATRSFMGKVRAFFQPAADYPVFDYGFTEGAPRTYGCDEWSMQVYLEQLKPYLAQNEPRAKEAWDELEKSVVAHVADDVKVSILGRTVEMTILKKLA